MKLQYSDSCCLQRSPLPKTKSVQSSVVTSQGLQCNSLHERDEHDVRGTEAARDDALC